MKRITALTEEQEKRLVDLRSEWLAIGYSTAPLDRQETVKIVSEFYARMGKAQPAILFLSSPAMCLLAWLVLKNFSTRNQLRSQLQSQLGGQLWGQLRGQLWGQLRGQLQSQLGSQLWGQLGGQLGEQLGEQLGSQLWGQLGSQLWGQLWGQLGSQLWGQLRGQLSNYCAGAHWCAWEVFYKFCEEIGVKYREADSKLLDLWLHQSRHLHWWFPYEGIALVSERYTVCRVDERGRLHGEIGPAVAYSDGWSVWAWHGVRVGQQVIEHPETLTAKTILAEENAEVRRVMMERVGMERFLSEADAKCVHRHEMGELFSIDLPGDPEGVLRSVRVKDPSTGRIYFLRVPPQIERADDAVAWTFGFDMAKQYKPLVES